MKLINNLLDWCRAIVRNAISRVAVVLDRLSGGRLTATHITLIGLLAHLPIAWLIATGELPIAAVLLAIFGLFDTLDGAMARVQNKESLAGMFLDSTTDRIKEVILYCGIVSYLIGLPDTTVIVVAVAALGASLLTSYINAWGEVTLAASIKKHTHKVNQALRIGLGGFEVRMALLVAGLILNRLEIIIYVILVLALLTIAQRIMNTLQRLQA
ncbi:archaetidylinositol phosphate synthase [soil metagenome]